MTIQEALDLVDELKPNMMARETKVKYLSILDGMIWHEIVMKHEPAQEIRWPVKFMNRIIGMIDNVLSLAELKDMAEMEEDTNLIRGEIHQEIITHQAIYKPVVLAFMTGIEGQFIDRLAQIHDTEDPLTKEELIIFLETVKGILQEKTKGEQTEPAYDGETDPGTVLIVPDPYAEELYSAWLMSKIDLQNREMGDYNNDRAMFENAYDTMQDWWNRTHMPVQRHRQFHI